MPRVHWREAAPATIKAQIIGKQTEFGPYTAVHHAMNCGFDYPDPPTPITDEFNRLLAAGDPASAALVKNHDINAWEQEQLAIQFVKARRDWARDTSIEHDQLRAKLDVEAKLMEERERFAVARANELRDQEEAAKHAARIEVARREWDAQHPAITAANGKAKEKRT